MGLFNKKYVYSLWDKDLLGKKVYVADSITELMDKVENIHPQLGRTIIPSGNIDFPFKDTNYDLHYRYAYYDSNIFKDSLVTHEELAKWLSTGNGELLSHNDVRNYMEYHVSLSNKQVPDHFLVRYYNTKKWLIPTYENLNI